LTGKFLGRRLVQHNRRAIRTAHDKGFERIRDERPTFRNLSLPVKTRPILDWLGNEKWAVTMMSIELSTVLNT
jgi:hypothetical protein